MKTMSRKLFVGVAVLFIGSIVGLFCANEASAAWPSTRATRCWSAGQGIFLKARIIPAGSGFYTVSHILIVNGSLNNVGSGTAYLRGDSIYWTAADAGRDSNEMWTNQESLVINRYTLAGQLEAFGHNMDYDDTSNIMSQYHGPFTLSPVSCSTIWQ